MDMNVDFLMEQADFLSLVCKVVIIFSLFIIIPFYIWMIDKVYVFVKSLVVR